MNFKLIEEYSYIDSYMDYKVGQTIIIKKSPNTWNHAIFNKYPLDSVSFPYICKIEALATCKEGYVAMTEGKFGWSLTSLIACKCIMSKVEMRKFKLRALENLPIFD